MSMLWYPKEYPLVTMAGMGGGATSLQHAGVVLDPTFAKLSSADADTKDTWTPVLSNNDLTAGPTANPGSNWHHGRSTLGFTTGKWYWEVTPTGNGMLGIEPTSENIDREFFNDSSSGIASRDGIIWFESNQVVSGQGDWSDGDTIGIAFNGNDGTIYFYINGSLSYSYDSTMSSSAFKKPAYSVYSGWTFTFNFGADGFDETPPTGYQALSTGNGASES